MQLDWSDLPALFEYQMERNKIPYMYNNDVLNNIIKTASRNYEDVKWFNNIHDARATISNAEQKKLSYLNNQVIIDLGDYGRTQLQNTAKLEDTVIDSPVTKTDTSLKFKISISKDIAIPFQHCFIISNSNKICSNTDDAIFYEVLDIKENGNATYSGRYYTLNEASSIWFFDIELYFENDAWILDVTFPLFDKTFRGGFGTNNISTFTADMYGIFISSTENSPVNMFDEESILSFLQYKARCIFGILDAFAAKNREAYKVSGKFKTRAKYKAGSGALKTPIYVYVEKDKVNYVHKQYNGQKIERDFSWNVRGHYRRIDANAYGKNMQGEYKLKGLTWVVPHVKGNITTKPKNERLYVFR